MLLKRAFVALATVCFNAYYRLCCKRFAREKMVLLTSQQQDTPSYDYLSLAEEFKYYGWTSKMHVGVVRRGNPFAYLSFVMSEIRLLSRSEIVFVDRYDPVVALIDFECESVVPEMGCWNDFPRNPIVIQLWHAFGAYKKFGYQSADVTEGHSSEELSLFKIHRNYSWVICSGEGPRKVFSEAFACPISRVIPLSRPMQRKLLQERWRSNGAKDANCPMVLFAPTVRKYDHEIHPFRELKKNSQELFDDAPFKVEWSFHPLEGNEAADNGSLALYDADYVVTDYSSIVYEAFLLGKRVVFYVPDIEHYRLSPGLNADPTALCPNLTAQSAVELVSRLSGWVQGAAAYPMNEFEAFVCGAFEGSGDDPAKAIVEFVISKVS